MDSLPVKINDLSLVPIPLRHGSMDVKGFRLGDFAYCTDCNEVGDEALSLLAGVRTLVLDALRHTPHPTHFTVEQALEIAQRVNAEQTFFTHIAHDLDHVATEAALPLNVRLAYDGLALPINV
jgi:phosphoribosyl 1,2-cyclic phosphate phosphodiesterase